MVAGTELPGGDPYLQRRPVGEMIDGAGHLFIADNAGDRVRRVDGATGIITTVAGNGAAGFSGDGGRQPSLFTAKPTVTLPLDRCLTLAGPAGIRPSPRLTAGSWPSP